MKRIGLAIAFVLLLADLLFGCASRGEPHSRWLSDQAQVHAEIDAALAHGQTDVAQKTLLAALAERAPVGVRPEVITLVRKDQLFRLADIYLEKGEPERALEASNRGVALGGERDLFSANLLVARGKALEALGREPDAAEAFHQALTINDELLHDLLQKD